MSDEERGGNDKRDVPRAGELLRWAEQTQRTIDFMVQQQAQFQAKSETDMQRLRELYERNEERWAQNEERWARNEEKRSQNEERWVRLSEEIRALLAIAEIHEGEINELRRTQAESQARADARMAETGGRVDALVNTVERLISERRNGGGKREEGSG